MHGLPVGQWFEMRSFGRRGTRNAAIGATAIVAALPVSLAIASTSRSISVSTWAGVLLLAAMVGFFILRALLALHSHADAYVTSISYIFVRRPDEARFRRFAEGFFERLNLDMDTTTVEGLPRYSNDKISLTILSAGKLAGIGGFSMKDHDGRNLSVLNAFQRSASRRFGLDTHVRNGKRVGGKRTRR